MDLWEIAFNSDLDNKWNRWCVFSVIVAIVQKLSFHVSSTECSLSNVQLWFKYFYLFSRAFKWAKWLWCHENRCNWKRFLTRTRDHIFLSFSLSYSFFPFLARSFTKTTFDHVHANTFSINWSAIISTKSALNASNTIASTVSFLPKQKFNRQLFRECLEYEVKIIITKNISHTKATAKKTEKKKQ